MTERLYIITSGDRMCEHPQAMRAATASTLVAMLEKCANEIEAQQLGETALKRNVSIYLQICDLEVGERLADHIGERNEMDRQLIKDLLIAKERDEAIRERDEAIRERDEAREAINSAIRLNEIEETGRLRIENALRSERDAARREACLQKAERMKLLGHSKPLQYLADSEAYRKSWDCFDLTNFHAHNSAIIKRGSYSVKTQ